MTQNAKRVATNNRIFGEGRILTSEKERKPDMNHSEQSQIHQVNQQDIAERDSHDISKDILETVIGAGILSKCFSCFRPLEALTGEQSAPPLVQQVPPGWSHSFNGTGYNYNREGLHVYSEGYNPRPGSPPPLSRSSSSGS
jgi:hypothetical protein